MNFEKRFKARLSGLESVHTKEGEMFSLCSETMETAFISCQFAFKSEFPPVEAVLQVYKDIMNKVAESKIKGHTI